MALGISAFAFSSKVSVQVNGCTISREVSAVTTVCWMEVAVIPIDRVAAVWSRAAAADGGTFSVFECRFPVLFLA